MKQTLLLDILIAVGLIVTPASAYFWFTKDPAAGPPFRVRNLFFGRRSIRESSRTHLLVEAVCLALMTAALLAWRLSLM